MENIDIDLGILEKYNLSPNELFVLRILLITQESENKQILFRFVSIPEKDRGDFRNVLLSLQEKGLILKSYKIPEKGEVFYPEEVPFNKNFIKNFHRDSLELGEELRSVYPRFGYINGNAVNLLGVAKKFDSIEDFCRAYGKAIKWNPEKHKEILDLITWAKDNTNALNQSIASFVINHSWEDLEALKAGNVANINFDAVTLI